MCRPSISILLGGILLSLLAMSGCTDRVLLEKSGLSLNAGFDYRPNGRLLLTSTMPVFGAPEKTKQPIEYVISVAHTVREARGTQRLKSSRPIVGGKVFHWVFGMKAAKMGISPYLDIIERDPQNSVRGRILVVEGTAETFLKKWLTFTDKPRPSIYLDELLDNAIQSGMASKDCEEFLFERSLVDPYSDPVGALFRANKNEYALLGSALFRDDKMVGQLNTRETLLLCLLRGDKVRGALTITIPGTKSNSLTSKASISVALVKRKCDVQRKATTGLKFFIDLKLEAQIEYYDGPSLLGNDVINRLTEALRKDIEYESYKLLCKFQKLKIDPVQLGRDAKSKHYDYVTKRWRELIPMSSYEVHSDVIIRRFGLRD